MLPMGSNWRRLLNQSTYSSVANSEVPPRTSSMNDIGLVVIGTGCFGAVKVDGEKEQPLVSSPHSDGRKIRDEVSQV